jgi:hypothetical protein
MPLTSLAFPGYGVGVAGLTRVRTAALAVLFVLGLLWPGPLGQPVSGNSDAVPSRPDRSTIAAVLTPAVVTAARTQSLWPGAGIAKSKHDGVTLSPELSLLGGVLAVPLLLADGRTGLRAAPGLADPSRAPPMAG